MRGSAILLPVKKTLRRRLISLTGLGYRPTDEKWAICLSIARAGITTTYRITSRFGMGARAAFGFNETGYLICRH